MDRSQRQFLRLPSGMAGTSGHARDIDWQEAVARLAQERTQAETCVRLLKKYGNATAIDHGELAYGEAKAEYDGLIMGLCAALTRKQGPASLPDLEARLQRGFAKREAFCESVKAQLPPRQGEKDMGVILGSVVIVALIEALKTIFLRIRDDDALMRSTIRTQLEATVWPDFATISAASI